MRMNRNILAFVGALALVPALALAATQTVAASQKPKAAAKAATKAATHSTSGTVQSLSDTSLVIVRAGKGKTKATETFLLNATTVKKGDVVVGARVGVRYVSDGGQNVATAVTVTAKSKDTAISR